MENTKNLRVVSNLDEYKDSSDITGSLHHKINMLAKAFARECEENQIPVFVAYYLPEKGYKYRSVFPEEIGTEEVQSEYDKFKKFLKVCIDFNKEDYMPNIQKKGE